MPWIKVFNLEEASGLLKKGYDEAIRRSGRIWNIVSIMSQNPSTLRSSMQFYKTILHGDSPLSRGQREMLAVTVSVANRCIY